MYDTWVQELDIQCFKQGIIPCATAGGDIAASSKQHVVNTIACTLLRPTVSILIWMISFSAKWRWRDVHGETREIEWAVPRKATTSCPWYMSLFISYDSLLGRRRDEKKGHKCMQPHKGRNDVCNVART
jgi:hypothetical protein